MLKAVGNLELGTELDRSIAAGGENQGISIAAFREVIKRQWPLILGVTFGVLSLALTYVALAPAKYTASTKLLVDVRRVQPFQQQQVVADQQLVAAEIESEVEVIRSDGLARTVVTGMGLHKLPEFHSDDSLRGRLAQWLPNWFGAEKPDDPIQVTDRAVRHLLNNLSVRRMAPTFVIQVEYTSLDATLAAGIVNTAADAYLVQGLDAAFKAKERTSVWLRERVHELRQRVDTADSAVQAFKARNNIVDTNRGSISEQQLSDVNAQLVTARAATAEAKARLDRMQQINEGGIPDATVADALRNAVITRLRAQFLDLASKEADWSARYGSAHVAVVNVRSQMAELNRAMTDELRRIAETYKSDFEIARSREESLRDSLASLIEANSKVSQAQVTLRELESTVQVYRALYDSFLQKLGETENQQALPPIHAQVVAPAAVPPTRSSPRILLITAGGALLGLLLGAGLAVMRETMNDVFRSPPDLARLPGGLEFLGVLPKLPAKAMEGAAAGDPAAAGRYALSAPFSRFTETLRNVKVAIDLTRLHREVAVIGLVSCLPGEGKTTTCSNLAHLIASMGYRTLLIDGDMRNPALTRALAPDAHEGLLQVLAQQRSITAVLRQDPATKMDFLPVVVPHDLANTAELLSSRWMSEVLEWARKEYEYVIVDMPPVLPVVDVKAASPLIDGFVMVIEWNVTREAAVLEALSAAPLILERSIGVVLNKGEVSALRRIESYKGPKYGGYYSDAKRDVRV